MREFFKSTNFEVLNLKYVTDPFVVLTIITNVFLKSAWHLTTAIIYV
jgi:hypothetical protein